MSKCENKKIKELLHLYELGQLSNKDRDEVEQHLLECDECFKSFSEFQEAARHMRHSRKFRDTVNEVVTGRQPITDRPKAKRFTLLPRKLSPAFVPTLVVALLAFVVLVLKPWQIEFRSTKEAVAAENRLAIMAFDNLAEPDDPNRLGEIAANLLIADLSESGYLQVISSQRLFDIQRLLKKEGNGIAGNEVRALVAGKAKAKWMITGSILQVKPKLELTTQVIEISSGDLMASQHITGNEDEDMFALVDRLTVAVKNDLSLPLAALREPDRNVADVTTHSPLAYRYYLEGLVNHNRFYYTEALESFKKALEIDSSFAMAYYYLSLIENTNYIYKAVENIDRAGQYDRYFIRSRQSYLDGEIELGVRELQEVLERNPDDKEAHYRLGICYASLLDFEQAIWHYTKSTEIDPLFKVAYNQMAYTYNWMFEFDKAIESIDMYIALAPDEANPYDSRGDIYTSNGRLEPAIESYAKALEIKPDFWNSLFSLGKNHLILGNFEMADSCFRELSECGHPSWRATGMAALALGPLYQGKFAEAIGILDEGITAAKTDTIADYYPIFHYLKAIAYEEINKPLQALKEYEESIRIQLIRFPDDKMYNRPFWAQLLAQTGDFEKAEEIAEKIRAAMVTTKDTLASVFARASIDLARGNLEQAVAGFEKTAEDTVIPCTPSNRMLAYTYMESGRWLDAIEVMEEFLAKDFTCERIYYSCWAAKVHYLMGLAHENLGQSVLAMEQYQIFLDIWRNADPGIAEVEDARQRLARLKDRS